MKRNSEPPVILDSTRVLFYAETGGADAYTGHITMNTGRTGHLVELAPVPRLAICEQLANGELLIMHCDESWAVLAVQGSPSIDSAKAIAERAYSGITSKWKPYRELSAEESAEVEAEREYLQRLDKEYPVE
jgi:hypothetical protein